MPTATHPIGNTPLPTTILPKPSAYSASLRLSALASLGLVASPWVATTRKGRLRVKNKPRHTQPAPMTTNAANSPHASEKFTAPHPPFSAKSRSTCQSNTDAENAETASPANDTHVRRIVRPTPSASAMNANHAPPTNAPISASSVRCELTSVLTVMPSGSINAVAISPEFPNPTPSGFTAKSLSPASQIFGLFITAPSSASLGHIHHAATASTANATDRVGTAFHRRPLQRRNGCGKAASALLATISHHHNTAASITNTTNPVRE